MFKKIVFFIVLFFLVGCNTAHKRAQKLLEGGQYSEAIKVYEQLIKEDPKDEKALIGLKQAREKYLDQKLIDIRLVRLAGDSQNAIDQLLDLIKDEREWSFFPTGQVAFTQEEESRQATIFATREIKNALEQNKPLRAAFWYTHYEPVFGKKSSQIHSTWKPQTIQLGKKKCKKFVAELLSPKKTPYYTDFLKQYCTYFGENSKQLKIKTSPLKQLYSELDWDFMGLKGKEKLKPLVHQGLELAFKSTAWFDGEGPQKISFKLDGHYHYRHKRNSITQVHSYSEKEPYTEYENVEKTKTVYKDGQAVKEVYSQKEPVTKYKEVQKSFSYPATEHRQEMDIQLSVMTKLRNKDFLVSSAYSNQKEGISHTQSNYGIGLYPQKFNAVNEQDWLKEFEDKIYKEFHGQLVSYWREIFCSDIVEGSHLQLSEMSHRCVAELKVVPPTVVQNWFVQNFGLKVNEVREIL